MAKVKKIVIVDDFTGIRAIVKEALEKKGYQVIEARNGEEALKYFDGTRVDLLITDIDMPELDGAGLIKRIRTMSQYTYTPVIVLSGIRKEKVEERISGLHVACLIQKPFDIKHFYSVVEKLVGQFTSS
jgi:two-component system, chemotaxis family, chemotaxis protein CheY